MLAKRLTKRGIAFSAALLGSLMVSNRASATPSVELIELTLRATVGNANLAVAALARGVLPMTQSFHRIAVPALLLFAILGFGLGAMLPQPAANAEEKPAAAIESKPEIAPDNVTIRVVDPEGNKVELWEPPAGQ